MKKTIELLKDFVAVKRAAAFSSTAALISVIAIGVFLKLGVDKWKTYNDPITWRDLYLVSPLLLLTGVVIFAVLFIFSLHDNHAEKSFVICDKCLDVYYPYQTKDNKCPDCNSVVELLTGFYERHPELREKNLRRKKQM